jgi:hypothetical protein
VSKAAKTCRSNTLFLAINSIDSMFGKKRGRGEVLLVDSLLITCLNVYRNPEYRSDYILRTGYWAARWGNSARSAFGNTFPDNKQMLCTLFLCYYCLAFFYYTLYYSIRKSKYQIFPLIIADTS